MMHYLKITAGSTPNILFHKEIGESSFTEIFDDFPKKIMKANT